MSSLIFGAQMEHAGRLTEENVYWRCNSGAPDESPPYGTPSGFDTR